MKKIITWWKSSNHGRHIVGGVLIGLGADDTYCALYAGAGVAVPWNLKTSYGAANGIGLTSAVLWQELLLDA